METLFISRAGADTAISETIAHVLEGAGYSVILQQRDFANKSFIAQMQASLESGARVVALLSPAYLASDYCAAEWQSVLADDPLNNNSRLIVIRVAECVPTGLLRALAYWDIVPVRDPQARNAVVLDAVRARSGQRPATAQTRGGSDGSAPVPIPATNLPPQLTAFVGRTVVVAEVKAAVAQGRLITLLGVGGIGKTRTALHVAGDVIEGVEDGRWFVDLARLSSGVYVVPEIASVLDVREEHGRPLLETLLAFLKAKRLLMILDNCEHVVADARAAADAIVRSCPGVRILATSREPLGVAGETVMRLPTLAVPDAGAALTAADALHSEAVLLFMARAQAADARFVMTDANAATVAEICRRLDGIALAIELAAARIKILNLHALAAKLDERFRLLTGGSKTVLPRQQTMRALIDWSYDLLDRDEQRLFRRLSIFAGGWTLEAAATVCGDEDEDEFAILDRMTSLADKSLVVVEFSEEAQRFRFLESIRAYALEGLANDGEFAELARRRAAFFAAFGGDGTLIAADVVARLGAIEAELENVREVLTWALEERNDIKLGARLAFALGRFWSMQQPREGQRWLKLAQAAFADDSDPVLAANIASAIAAMLPHGSFERFEATERALEASRLTDAPRIRTKALAAYGEQLAPLGRLREARTAFEEALEQALSIGSDWDAGRALAGLAQLALDENDLEAARELGHQAIATFDAIAASDGVAYVCITLGEAEFIGGHVDRALKLIHRARAAYGTLHNYRSSACAANYLAAYSFACDKPDDARTFARDALGLLQTDRHPMFFAEAIAHLAHYATLSGDPQRGALLLGYADAAYEKLAHRRGYSAQWCHDAHLRSLAQAFDAAELAAQTAAGGHLSEDRALEEALAI